MNKSLLESLAIHPPVSRFFLSSYAPVAVTHARSCPVVQPCAYCLAWDSLRATHGGRVSLVGLLSYSRPDSSAEGNKKRRNRIKGQLIRFLLSRKEVSILSVILLCAGLDMPQSYIYVSLCAIGCVTAR